MLLNTCYGETCVWKPRFVSKGVVERAASLFQFLVDNGSKRWRQPDKSSMLRFWSGSAPAWALATCQAGAHTSQRPLRCSCSCFSFNLPSTIWENFGFMLEQFAPVRNKILRFWWVSPPFLQSNHFPIWNQIKYIKTWSLGALPTLYIDVPCLSGCWVLRWSSQKSKYQ